MHTLNPAGIGEPRRKSRLNYDGCDLAIAENENGEEKLCKHICHFLGDICYQCVAIDCGVVQLATRLEYIRP